MRLVDIVRGVGLIWALALALPSAQTSTQFDVVSIKKNTSDVPQMMIRPRNNRFNASNVTPQFLLRWAFETPNIRIVGLPDWATKERFDITATGPDQLTDATARPLAKALLAERFGLRTHVETRDLPVYLLVPRSTSSRVAPNLRSAEGTCVSTNESTRPSPPRVMFPSAASAPCGLRLARGHISGGSVAMADVAEAISRDLDRTVLDRSNVVEKVDLVLNFTQEAIRLLRANRGDVETDDSFPSVFTAVQEQLGLRLDPGTAPLEVLVIDQLNQPTPN